MCPHFWLVLLCLCMIVAFSVLHPTMLYMFIIVQQRFPVILRFLYCGWSTGAAGCIVASQLQTTWFDHDLWLLSAWSLPCSPHVCMGFLPLSQNMVVAGLAMQGVKVCMKSALRWMDWCPICGVSPPRAHCSQEWLLIHCNPDQIKMVDEERVYVLLSAHFIIGFYFSYKYFYIKRQPNEKLGCEWNVALVPAMSFYKELGLNKVCCYFTARSL